MAKRKHVPALTPLELEAALERLKALKISAAGKAELEQIMRAASNPAGESPDVLIKGLSEARQATIREGLAALTKTTRTAGRRARAALMDMDEAEFQRLVDEANEQ